MTRDPVFESFLQSAAIDADLINGASDVVRLVAEPGRGTPPDSYLGVFEGLPRFVHDLAGWVRRTREPLAFRIKFPPDYLASLDPALVARVVRLRDALVHPNVRADGLVCLLGFRPGTRLRGLVVQLHALLSARVFDVEHPFDLAAASFFARNLDRVRQLQAPPLWRSPLASSVRVRASAREASS